MTVADLILLLQQQNPSATVVLWDHDTNDDSPCVAKLRHGEVQPIELGTWESNGVLILEVWSNGFKQDGPIPGVVLGGNR